MSKGQGTAGKNQMRLTRFDSSNYDEWDNRPCRWLVECSELWGERHCTKLNELDCPYADEFYYYGDEI